MTMQNGTATWENILAVSYIAKHILPYHPTISSLRFYLRKVITFIFKCKKIYFYIRTYTQMITEGFTHYFPETGNEALAKCHALLKVF